LGGGRGGLPLLVVAAEKSGLLEPYKVSAVLRGFASGVEGRGDYLRVGLIVYAGRPLPILDPVEDVQRLVEAYEEAPVLEGPPNPALALREAGEMLLDYSTPLPGSRLVLLLWSLKSRPRRVLRVAAHYVASLGAGIALVAFTSKRRPWLQRYFPQGTRVFEVESPPARLGRLGESLVGLVLPAEDS